MNLEQKIEALLLWKGEPLTIKKLADYLEAGETEINEAVKNLGSKLFGRGICVIRSLDEITLGTNPELSELIKKISREELDKDIGKAGLETLSIILYKCPVSRKYIDYIRGVNSTFILRNLMIRGLVERVQNKDDQRSFLYKPTLDLLGHLGLSKLEDLPEFANVKYELENFSEKITDNQNNENVQ